MSKLSNLIEAILLKQLQEQEGVKDGPTPPVTEQPSTPPKPSLTGSIQPSGDTPPVKERPTTPPLPNTSASIHSAKDGDTPPVNDRPATPGSTSGLKSVCTSGLGTVTALMK